MNKSIYTLAVLIAAAPSYGVEYPKLSPDQTAQQQEQLLLDTMDKEGLTEQKLETNPSLERMRQMHSAMRNSLQLEHLHEDMAFKLLLQYFSFSPILASSPEDMDALQSEIKALAVKYPSIKQLWEDNLSLHFAAGSKAFFEKTQPLRDELHRKLNAPPLSAERKEQLRKENEEIRAAIIANKAVVSVENPTQEEYIRRRDTLAPFLARKDFAPETAMELLRNYNACALRAAKNEQDLQESKKKLQTLAENYPQQRELIESMIQHLYSKMP